MDMRLKIAIIAKMIKRLLGVLLIIFGIIGLFVPILQGILMIFGGLSLLGIKKSKIKRWFKKWTQGKGIKKKS